jgi:hypothetical protein
VPEDENPFGFESVFCFNHVLYEKLPIVVNFGPHVVNKEWLSEAVFIVCEWHCLEVKSHLGSTFHISELVPSRCCVAVNIEEFR